MVTRGELIDEALDVLYRSVERPGIVVVGSDDLASSSDTQLTLSYGADDVSVTDLLEINQELMLVTAKSDDATPVFTVQRGWLSTPVESSVATGSSLKVNPTWLRRDVSRHVTRALTGPIQTYLPNVVTSEYTIADDSFVVELPAETLRVIEVKQFVHNTMSPVEGWVYDDNLPASVSSTGKALLFQRTYPSPYDDIIVVSHEDYEWSGSGEAATVTLEDGTENLPSTYAVCRLITGREVSRSDLDKLEEWPQEQTSVRSGTSLRVVQSMWQDFYRQIDEARRNRPRAGVTHKRRKYFRRR